GVWRRLGSAARKAQARRAAHHARTQQQAQPAEQAAPPCRVSTHTIHRHEWPLRNAWLARTTWVRVLRGGRSPRLPLDGRADDLAAELQNAREVPDVCL